MLRRWVYPQLPEGHADESPEAAAYGLQTGGKFYVS